jgi:hypothetical protein
MALKEIFEANEFHIEEDRTTLNQLVDIFFPLLEQVMMEAGQSSSGNQILVMHLISKIFFSANNVRNNMADSVACGRSVFLGHASKDNPLDELLPECPGDESGATVRDAH